MVRERLEELNVQRLNVVDADGTLRIAISGKDKLPDPILGGRQFKRQGPKLPGIIFFNDDGDECGGLVFGGSRDPADARWAGMHLSFDQLGNDQILVLAYEDEGGRRSYGLRFYDRSGDLPVEEVLRLSTMPEGQEKDRLLKELRDRGAFPFPRMFVGRDADGRSTITLSDGAGRPRLRLAVDSTGGPRVELLDEAGTAVHALPSASDAGRMADLERQVIELREEVKKLKAR